MLLLLPSAEAREILVADQVLVVPEAAVDPKHLQLNQELLELLDRVMQAVRAPMALEMILVMAEEAVGPEELAATEMPQVKLPATAALEFKATLPEQLHITEEAEEGAAMAFTGHFLILPQVQRLERAV
jgi:hypothetical protein